jgi:hypothetical protein
LVFERLKSSIIAVISISSEEEEPRTFEQMCLDKLKEIGISTASEWCTAMGNMHRSSLAKVIRRILTKTPERLKVYYNIKPRQYEAL